ncbi:unnamed protein product [Moneuplotes crassus]|uniref:Uncharacterized protein n=1 Tax=Euplotes crassus TaxID=5936 RepID=A0AAD1XX00_EUPCR|nr:unnamed protein product [Moneuplotes crassus]
MNIIIIALITVSFATANVCQNQAAMITAPISGEFVIPGASISYFIDIFENQESGFLYFIGFYNPGSSPDKTVIYKSDYDLAKVKIMTYDIYSVYFSFTIDPNEGTIYTLDRTTNKILGISTDTLDVIRELSITGATVSGNSQIAWNDKFFFSLLLNSVMETCRWDMATPNLNCFNFGVDSFTNLAPISSDLLFFGSVDSVNDKYYMINYNFSTTPSIVWQKSVSCPTAGCSIKLSKSAVSRDGQSIFAFILYDDHFLFYMLSVVDGTPASSGFIWNNAGSNVYSVKEFDQFIALQILSSSFAPNYTRLILIASDGQSIFKEYKNSGASSYNAFQYKSGENELVYFPGIYRPSGSLYFARVLTSEIDRLSEFTNDTLIFTAITTSYTASVPTSNPSLTSTPRTLSVSSSSSITSADLTSSITPSFSASPVWWNADHVQSVQSNSLVKLDFTWACTHSVDSTVITFTLAQTGTNSIPDWVEIDTTNQELYLNKTPKLSVSQTYYFSLQITYNSETEFKRFEITVEGCSISSCEMCKLGDQTICDNCANGFQVSNDNKSCSKVETEPETTTASNSQSTAAATGLVGSSAAIASVSSILSGSSISSFFSVMNSLQLAILLPLIPKYFPIDVLAFLKGMSFAMLSFDFIKLEEIPFVEDITEWIDYPQPDEYLGSIGMSSGSSLINYLSFLVFICFIGICHLCIVLCRGCILKTKNKKLSKLMDKLFEFFTFNLYLRILIQAYLFTIWSIFSEIYALNLSTVVTKISFGVCVTLTLCTNVVLLLSLLVYFKSFPKIDVKKYWPCIEFFSGVKEGRYSKLYSSLFLLLRLLSVSLLIFGNSLPSSYKAAGFLLFNGGYGAYLLAVRPFENLQDNIIEAINQILFCCLIVPLIWVDTESDWNASYESYFTRILLLSPAIGCVICFIFLIKSICTLFCKKKKPVKIRIPKTIAPKKTDSEVLRSPRLKRYKLNKREEHKEYRGFTQDLSQSFKSGYLVSKSNASFLRSKVTHADDSSTFQRNVQDPRRVLQREE